MLEIKNLSFKHKGQKEEILKDISFVANQGEITTILGPNGTGKTTLFKCITGVWGNYRGEIIVNKKKVDNLSFTERAKFFSVVPQDHEPPFPYSVFEVVLMGRASYVGIFSSPNKRDYEKVEETLELIGIYHLRDKPYTKISGGERQLTLIARALVQETPVIILDEPTSHLDFKNQQLILSKIKEITKEKSLITVITLHDPNLASLFSDKVVIIKDGKVLHNGHPSEVMNKSILKEVYGVEVEVIKYNGINLVFPKI
ncbi:MAG: ABC transporter ATP-binding protein [Thermodesulfobacterium geofontis]|uniref:ABC transporter ATP-binding protein n=1 Tax=Thermodesulfobacterium geofontis TaxID=1295609 RepID=A0A2N7QAY7_9BACT|nr:MAG: ABC transporter ATP-binding protein [Thermodesulfobacterium geofontis]